MAAFLKSREVWGETLKSFLLDQAERLKRHALDLCTREALGHEPEKRVRKNRYCPWAELLERTFAVDVLVVDVLTCPNCQGRMRLLAVVKNPVSLARYLAAAGELTDVPDRSPPRTPPYWKSQVLRRQALGDEGHDGDHGRGDDAT